MSRDHQVNILLVDDDRTHLNALETVLECLGQNLVKVSSGVEAVGCVLEEDFAVVLLDVQMPGMSGIEAAARIRAAERSRATPIIFLTGLLQNPEMMFDGYSAGAVDYLTKPVVSAVLRAKIEVFVELAIARQKVQEEAAERMRIAGEVSKLNMELKRRNEALQEANGDLESFANSISHDLRTPLRHIHCYMGLLEESAGAKLDAQESQHMRTVCEAVVRMQRLIDGLLAFSHISRAEMCVDTVDMRSLVEDIVADMQTDIAGRNVQWRIGELPEVHGDANLLRQVWTNIIENSVKYTRPRARALIEICATAAPHEIVFEVRDNGVGFDAQHADRLFAVFQRLHSDAEFEGTGVGLANVRRIVQRHGGRTWAEGRLGEGTTVYFTMPASERARVLPQRDCIHPGAAQLQ